VYNIGINLLSQAMVLMFVLWHSEGHVACNKITLFYRKQSLFGVINLLVPEYVFFFIWKCRNINFFIYTCVIKKNCCILEYKWFWGFFLLKTKRKTCSKHVFWWCLRLATQYQLAIIKIASFYIPSSLFLTGKTPGV
jgi:hypothetical protein